MAEPQAEEASDAAMSDGSWKSSSGDVRGTKRRFSEANAPMSAEALERSPLAAPGAVQPGGAARRAPQGVLVASTLPSAALQAPVSASNLKEQLTGSGPEEGGEEEDGEELAEGAAIGRMWTKAEDRALSRGVAAMGAKCWKTIR